jgi:hypothetical protein
MQMKVDTFTKTVYRSVEELQHDIAARGLNMRAFGQLLLEAHQAKAGDYATIGNGSDSAAESGRPKSVGADGNGSAGNIIDVEAEPSSRGR